MEYLYICEHGTRARVQLGSEHCGLVNDNLSAEVMDTPTCCTDNKTIYLTHTKNNVNILI